MTRPRYKAFTPFGVQASACSACGGNKLKLELQTVGLRTRGFTLLELMLAIAMSATIAGSLAASLYIGFRARNSAEAAVESTHVTNAIGDIMVRDLSLMLPPTGVLAGSFEGQADNIAFYAAGAEPKAPLQAGCRYIQYGLVQDTDGSSMLVRMVTTNLLAPVQPDPTQERICRNVQSLAFAYYDGTEWQDTWDSTQQNNEVPLAVQITVVLNPRVEGEQPIQETRTVKLYCGTATNTGMTATVGGQ